MSRQLIWLFYPLKKISLLGKLERAKMDVLKIPEAGDAAKDTFASHYPRFIFDMSGMLYPKNKLFLKSFPGAPC
jgi:hypothetical protein